MYNGFCNIDDRYTDGRDTFGAGSNVGSPIMEDFVLQTDKNGVENLEKVGEYNLYDRIQSHADSCDIHVILARFNAGDTSALNQKALAYFDTKAAPDTLAEAHRYIQNGQYMFDRLDPEVKAQFNNSFSEFCAAIGTEKFYDALKEKEHHIDDEVKEIDNAES